MALFVRKSPEEAAQEAEDKARRQADEAAAKQERRREADERRAAAAREKEIQAFMASPAGRAREAFGRGDRLFQFGIDVMSQEAVIVAMVGGSTTERTTDPNVVLNSVCNEGWDLVTGSFVFIEQEQQSRDKFMSSGQNVAVKGRTEGYYLFKRAESLRVADLPTAPGSEHATDQPTGPDSEQN